MRSDEPEPIWTEDEEFGVPPEPVRKPKPDLGPEWETDDGGLDTTDVRLDDPDTWGRREPDWVIRTAADTRDTELGTIKSGKEAEVALVRRTAPDQRTCLLAVKRYRPRGQRAFRREDDYWTGQSLGDSRLDRAVRNRSRVGRDILEYAWAYREYPVMRKAWELGARVPYPVEETENGLAMQYLGDSDTAAPRLADIRLDGKTAAHAFDAIIESVRCLLDVYLVHADLSAYNILWWHEEPWLIDFPQAVDIANHPQGLAFLRRDIHNVCRHFRRWGVQTDTQDVLDDVLRTSPIAW